MPISLEAGPAKMKAASPEPEPIQTMQGRRGRFQKGRKEKRFPFFLVQKALKGFTGILL